MFSWAGIGELYVGYLLQSILTHFPRLFRKPKVDIINLRVESKQLIDATLIKLHSKSIDSTVLSREFVFFLEKRVMPVSAHRVSNSTNEGIFEMCELVIRKVFERMSQPSRGFAAVHHVEHQLHNNVEIM